MMTCDKSFTLTEVKNIWMAEIKASPPVAFFTSTNRFLPDRLTVEQALQETANTRVLELQALPTNRFQLQVFGFERSLTPFEVADVVTPNDMRREMQRLLGIATDDYRLTCGSRELDADVPFKELELSDGAVITADLQLRITLRQEQEDGQLERSVPCFGSQTVGALHEQLDLGDDVVLVATAPYRRVLDDALHLCHLAEGLLELHAPIEIEAEKKTLLTFEPIGLEHRRQQVPVSLSSCPSDVKQLLKERFELTTDFRLSIDGAPLVDHQPLLDQLIDSDSIIQLDLLRPCLVTDLWSDLREAHIDNEVLLYSTESPVGLFLRDFISDQRLLYDGIQLTIYGTVIDVFGAVTGQRTPALLIERDVERSLPMLSFASIERKLAWARSMLLDVVPVSRGLRPKEVMCHRSLVAAKASLKQLSLTADSLLTLDPVKVIVQSNKKLRIHRFAHGSTARDVLQRIQLLKGRRDLTLRTRYNETLTDEKIHSGMDIEFYLLWSSNRCKTRVSVSLNGHGYGCWFEAERVSFSEIMIEVGKQSHQLPRHLFSRSLFCCGCGRKICKDEEATQSIPSSCCSVRSLRLTDRKLKSKAPFLLTVRC